MRALPLTRLVQGVVRLVGPFVWLFPTLAWAFPIDAQVVGKVSSGKAPHLLLHATESVSQLAVELSREDGKSFKFSLGALPAEQEKVVSLDGSLGRHEYQGKMVATLDGEKSEVPLAFVTVVAPPLEVTIRPEDLDLAKQTLRFKASRRLASASLAVLGLAEQTLSSQRFELASHEGGTLIPLNFGPVPREELLRLELHVEDSDGFFRTVTLTPWSVHIPHEEVLFESNSSLVPSREESKLEASLGVIQEKLARYQQIRGVSLYIAGHTDTRGKPEHNRELSRRRAQAIAAWFVSHGLPLRVFYEGFGEAAPKVKTADEVDEPANRRADYILSIEAPPVVGGAWRALN